MATTPARKVRDGKTKSSHVRYDETPGFFGDEETLKSGGATADRYEPISAAASVEGGPPAADMCEIPGGFAATGRPEKGNARPKKLGVSHIGRGSKDKGNVSITTNSGAQRGRPGGGY